MNSFSFASTGTLLTGIMVSYRLAAESSDFPSVCCLSVKLIIFETT